MAKDYWWCGEDALHVAPRMRDAHRWLSIDWKGFACTRSWVMTADEFVAYLGSVTVTEESRSARHRRAKFTAAPPE